jgi:glutamate synthase (NADPH/NADH) large chain
VFAYDPGRLLDTRLNSELVVLGGLSEDDQAALRQLLVEHRVATDSALATRLLDRWPEAVASFCRISPKAASAAIPTRPVAEPARLRA